MTDRIPVYLQSHVIAGDRMTFSLDQEARELQAQASANRRGVTLFKDHGLSLVLLAMPAGNEVADHTAPGPLTVQVLSGRVEIRLEKEAIDGYAGTLAVLGPNVAHSLHAKEASVVLLTLAPAS
ncbi:MAG: cupin domain-containing protein [Dehalococcoidia bacterium]|nr:cupin domain-containing protein [Dehalococcoidia bacterium]